MRTRKWDLWYTIERHGPVAEVTLLKQEQSEWRVPHPTAEVQPTSVAPFARRQSALLDPVLARPQHELFEVRLRSCEELLISVLAFPSGGG